MWFASNDIVLRHRLIALLAGIWKYHAGIMEVSCKYHESIIQLSRCIVLGMLTFLHHGPIPGTKVLTIGG